MSEIRTIRISAGRGPVEARHFVAMLAEALREHLLARGVAVHGVEHHGAREAPGRVALRVSADLERRMPELLGTHLLLAELRGPRSRRRWFAAVELDDGRAPAEPLLPRHELDLRFVRSRGPGGQNVNKRATAVQITHRPSGLQATCDRHRSQVRNRIEALACLRRRVAEHTVERERDRASSDAWEARRELLTREPVMCWRLDPRRPDAIVPA
ncbi:MAG: hypothetical protein H6712_24115 [Myxococcales bacterium]|nr:hypothetical protein [Myxococcales bacterium]